MKAITTIHFMEQLDGSPNEGGNCGPLGGAHGIDFMTRGKVRPSAEAVRARMRPEAKPDSGTNTAQLLAAIEAFGPEFKRAGLSQPNASRHVAEGHDWVREALAAGHAVILCIDYGYINDHFPRYSGDPAFQQGHTLLLVGWGLDWKGRRATTVYDGLHDGRRAGIPEGPIVARFDAYREAANSFAAVTGDGHATGIVVRHSKVIAKPQEPPAEPVETKDETIARLRALLGRTKEQLETTTGSLAAADRRVASLSRALATADATNRLLSGALVLARNALLDVGNDAEAALDAIDEALPRPAEKPGRGATAGAEKE